MSLANKEMRFLINDWDNRSPMRPNIESSNGATSQNGIDPMLILANRHDRLPKIDLDDGYIGDGYPLCSDLPAQDFLRKGVRG